MVLLYGDQSILKLVPLKALVEKGWIAFGHPFADHIGLPSVSGTSFYLTRQSSTGSILSSPARQSSGSFTPQASNSCHAQNNYSPIFLQWVSCVSQLLRIYPFPFEFSSAFLVEFFDCVISCHFGNLFCNRVKTLGLSFKWEMVPYLVLVTSRWTSEEKAELKAGVLKHGTGKWRNIRSDPELSSILRSRSNVDLKVCS
ncbi:hypothetical protein F3Y22_tig00112293pilonHSYRG00388 [Hibiscus syriacus]|uniref:MYB transcription factor n=1 Tax=Hibiscus syriacus TaxID=106335 RepID=A0A6A2X1L1_HIBSY|nr:hypothetical protein F3Y22_tig00112293pilonHSYRG00388 [Hibiscus syriacus]